MLANPRGKSVTSSLGVTVRFEAGDSCGFDD
jgi:hypothetical protein